MRSLVRVQSGALVKSVRMGTPRRSFAGAFLLDASPRPFSSQARGEICGQVLITLCQQILTFSAPDSGCVGVDFTFALIRETSSAEIVYGVFPERNEPLQSLSAAISAPPVLVE